MKLSILVAGAITALSAATPALARTGGYYRATLAAPATKPMLVTRDTVWRCTDAVCTAAKGGARDGVVCELVAKGAGRLAAFAAGGTEFPAEALTKCNARAK